MAKDYYVQPNAPDPVLDDETVLALVRPHLPGAQGVRRVDESGGEARTYHIDDDFIFKTQRPQQLRPRTSLRKEVLFLNAQQGVEGVRVPRVIAYGHPRPALEYTLMTRMPGVAVRHATLQGPARADALRDLGRMLRRIHAIPQEALRAGGLFFGDQSPVDVRWRMGSLFDDAAESIRKQGGDWPFRLAPDEVGRRLMRALPDLATIVALHSNPGPEHSFVDPIDGRLTGVIDFGDAYFSHPVFDLRRFRAPVDRRCILEGYLEAGLPDDTFLPAWRTACAVTDLLAIANAPEQRDAAMEELEEFLRLA